MGLERIGPGERQGAGLLGVPFAQILGQSLRQRCDRRQLQQRVIRELMPHVEGPLVEIADEGIRIHRQARRTRRMLPRVDGIGRDEAGCVKFHAKTRAPLRALGDRLICRQCRSAIGISQRPVPVHGAMVGYVKFGLLHRTEPAAARSG